MFLATVSKISSERIHGLSAFTDSVRSELIRYFEFCYAWSRSLVKDWYANRFTVPFDASLRGNQILGRFVGMRFSWNRCINIMRLNISVIVIFELKICICLLETYLPLFHDYIILTTIFIFSIQRDKKP